MDLRFLRFDFTLGLNGSQNIFYLQVESLTQGTVTWWSFLFCGPFSLLRPQPLTTNPLGKELSPVVGRQAAFAFDLEDKSITLDSDSKEKS